jgi:23S rRNA pseudouridine2605 synthase
MANQYNKPFSGNTGAGKKFSDKKGPYDKRKEESSRFRSEGGKFKGEGEGKKVFNRSSRFDRPAEEGKRFGGRPERPSGESKGPFKSAPKYKSRFGSSNERNATGAGYPARGRKEGDQGQESRSSESYRPASGEKWRERRESEGGSRGRYSDKGADRGNSSDRKEGTGRYAGPPRGGSKYGDRDQTRTNDRNGSRYNDRAKEGGESARGKAPYRDKPREGGKESASRFGDRTRATDRERPAGRYNSNDRERPADRFTSNDRERPAGGDRFKGSDQGKPGSERYKGTGQGRGRYSESSKGFGGKREDRTDRPREERGPRREDRAPRREGDVSRETRFPSARPEAPRSRRPAAEAPTYDLKRYDDREKKKKAKDLDDFKDAKMRLNRYIANAGICSRREADELIQAGEIKVNGEVVTEMGYMVGPEDTVQYGKKKLNREKMVYVLLNKPKDFITTTEDPEGRKTVMDLVNNASKERIFPVGRLDRNTTGLLLFTNDGELAQKLSHPSHKNAKIYQVELDRPLVEADFIKVQEGVELEDGKAEVDELAIITPDKKTIGIEVHIGKNRIVRRIFESLGYDVVTLDRVQYAGLTKKDLPRGKWRFLSEKEVIRLKYFM